MSVVSVALILGDGTTGSFFHKVTGVMTNLESRDDS